MLSRARLALCVLAVSGVSFACGGEPPTKEMHDAQTAIDAARAAGADVYAAEEFNASQEALKHAREAADQRDYRLALNNALDSRERAQNAVAEAGAKRAAARTDADVALRKARTSALETQTKLEALDTKANARALAGPKARMNTVQQHLQEASAAFAAEDYIKSAAATKAAVEALSGVNQALDTLASPSARRRR